MNPSPASTFSRVFAVCAALAVSQPATADEAGDELSLIRQKISGMFETIEPENVNSSPVDGWYEIQKGSVIAYISGNGRYLLQGDLIDLDQQLNLSELARTDARRELMASVTDAETILFSPQDTKYSVSVFTDVECAYCRRLHSQINDYLAAGIQVRYLLYPRNGPASRAWNTSEEVWCSPDRRNALTMAKLDRKFETSSCDASIVQSHYTIGQNVGLSGTPAIVLEDGTLIGGYLTPDQLLARLEQNSAAHK